MQRIGSRAVHSHNYMCLPVKIINEIDSILMALNDIKLIFNHLTNCKMDPYEFQHRAETIYYPICCKIRKDGFQARIVLQKRVHF